MICPKCNQDIPDGTTVCPNCSSAIEQLPIATPADNKKEKPSPLAIISLILSIFSFILCWIFFIALIPLILSITELHKIKVGKSSKAGKKYATVGLIISCISIIFYILIIIPEIVSVQTRTKVSQTKGGQNTIAVGLEAYYLDHHTYPSPDYDAQGNPIVPHSLTTPVAYYISALPIDPFSEKKKERFHYFTGPVQDTTRTYWIITSNGPDKKMDLDILKYNPTEPYWNNLQATGGTYDPTNGTISSGDVWRLGP